MSDGLTYEEKTTRVQALIAEVQKGTTLSATLEAAKEGALLIHACTM